jgi:hypothetical protein
MTVLMSKTSYVYRNTHDKKINSDTQGDDYILRTVWFCALTLPERLNAAAETRHATSL